MTCTHPDISASWAYRGHGCRCDRCRAWKRSTRTYLTSRPVRRLPDDGIIDPVAVTGLINGTVTADRATYQEALQAARDTYGRDGWWAWCQDTLRLRSPRIRAIADECERVAS